MFSSRKETISLHPPSLITDMPVLATMSPSPPKSSSAMNASHSNPSTWLTNLATKARKLACKSAIDTSCATSSHQQPPQEPTATTAKASSRRSHASKLLPIAIPVQRAELFPKRASATSLHSPTAWSHAFPASDSAKPAESRKSMALSERSVSTSNSDQDNLETPTQETVCAFSDKLTARQFASLTRMDVQLWDDEEEEEDSAVLAPPPPLTDDTTLCSSSQMDSDTESCTSLMETLSTSLSSSMPSTTSNSTVSSATSSISSTCSRGSGPRLDMSIFIPPSSSPSTHSPQLFTGSLPRRVSSTDAPLPSSPVPFIRSHVRTPSAPNFPISPQPPVQSSPNLSPAVLLANWKPLALTPATSSSAGHSHIALGINTSIASLASPSTSFTDSPLRRASASSLRSFPHLDPRHHLHTSPSSTSLSSTSTSSSSSSISPTSPPPRQLGGSLDRVTTITKKGRFTVVKEPSSHYYSHVRRVSVSVASPLSENEDIAAALSLKPKSRFVIEKARADTCDSGVDMA